jgi:signal-transduction protein with cAMP-binding, CBS, and nucleotidyltransferase domain
MMDYRGINSLVVVSKKKLAGIVPEKDLYTRVVAKGVTWRRLRSRRL